jgi:hypothetical protein
VTCPQAVTVQLRAIPSSSQIHKYPRAEEQHGEHNDSFNCDRAVWQRHAAMQRPPPELDNAKVLRWAISARGAFHHIGDTAIAAVAIGQYANSGELYLFKCTVDWNAIGDWDCQSIDEGMEIAAQHSNTERLVWEEE